jgi:hypothetical protein
VVKSGCVKIDPDQLDQRPAKRANVWLFDEFKNLYENILPWKRYA